MLVEIITPDAKLFEGEVNSVLERFSALSWHLIYQNCSRHSNFTIEKDQKFLLFSLLCSECFHI